MEDKKTVLLIDLSALWSKISFPRGGVGCWIWHGARNQSGYGMNVKYGKTRVAHRVIYSNYAGEIPDGLELDHLCRNRACVNPGHMEPVTRSENIRRSDAWVHLAHREKSKKTCKNGHAFDSDNTYRPARGGRICRKCRAAVEQRRRDERVA